jgi:Zn-finger nucleic acid-binding protein
MMQAAMAHRDESPNCPSCKSALQPAGRRFTCAQCGGVLIAATDLELMMNEMSPDDGRPIDQRLFEATHARRECPRCPVLMTTWSLHGVALDRCADHGIWFDNVELARVLQANGNAYAERQVADRPPSSLGGILGSTLRAIFRPWLQKRRLAKDIERTSPKSPDRKP